MYQKKDAKQVSFRKFSILIPLVLGAGWYIWGQYIDKNIEKEHQTFYKTEIRGKILNIGTKAHGTSLLVSNNEHTFLFYPYTDEYLNKNHKFSYWAEKGDSVYKSSNNDTLLLIKSNQTYKYPNNY